MRPRSDGLLRRQRNVGAFAAPWRCRPALAFHAALGCLLAARAGAVKYWSASEVPNPAGATEHWQCEQDKPSHFCNPEHYLAETDNVLKALNALESDYEYPGCGGYEMGVVVVGRTLNKIDHFARGVMDSWGIGKAACNNGIVMALAVEDRKMYIATGRGAREHLPDVQLQGVIERMQPLMRDLKYSAAVQQGISDIARLLSGQRLVWTFFGWRPQQLFQLALWLGLAAYLLSSCRSRRRYTRCRATLEKVEADRRAAGEGGYRSTSCPICLEDFAGDGKDKEMLQCGHCFHARCIQEWERRNSTCPICRAEPLQAEGGGYGSHQPYDSEYHFRLGRVHHYYPEYVSTAMVQRWAEPGYGLSPTADVAFIQKSPNYQSSSSGGVSSGGGFGGGCSAGGGGAGGGW